MANAGCRRRHRPRRRNGWAIGKLKGCRVVGIGGVKSAAATDVLDLICALIITLIISHNSLRGLPAGYRYSYENVGGKVFDAVLPLLNTSARFRLLRSGHGLQCDSVAGRSRQTASADGFIITKKAYSSARFYHQPDYMVTGYMSFSKKWGVDQKKENTLPGADY
ncbi:hypothetical protein KCP77_14455 [Salmonella enterica subsp. enterica]|nr:hypothetical protein KCP77_14455 [Salmonella enterica subsp. enterica]